MSKENNQLIPKNILEILEGLKNPIETNNANNEPKENSKENQKHKETKPYEVLKKYLEELVLTKNKLEEQNLESIAKIQTMARRHKEEEISIRKYGGIKLAEEIIKPIDLFKKVLEMPTTSDEVKNYLMGFNMIVNQLEQVFSDNGITVISVKPGDKFDHTIHNANEAIESNDYKKDEVVQVISNGYKMHDRVIVHAIVKVAK
ncbi:heat shock protein GrpE [Williamsoniiplasma somnilux]|uniref:Protein GrpE n=1 Tax=Williamsoniiplasma somnilux TaxID=215578 RepID=A0A2K8P027_9MOLU|nr:nucleotide exchange factor GrpE [Williamsoniiplasma somnilux]ATZ18808.1 heat shock protein GrpE [Williamsoniiplasma somnilux]